MPVIVSCFGISSPVFRRYILYRDVWECSYLLRIEDDATIYESGNICLVSCLARRLDEKRLACYYSVVGMTSVIDVFAFCLLEVENLRAISMVLVVCLTEYGIHLLLVERERQYGRIPFAYSKLAVERNLCHVSSLSCFYVIALRLIVCDDIHFRSTLFDRETEETDSRTEVIEIVSLASLHFKGVCHWRWYHY